MQIKFSKTLSEIFDRLQAQVAEGNPVNTDRVMLEILCGNDCHATFILGKLLNEEKIDHIRRQLAAPDSCKTIPANTLAEELERYCGNDAPVSREGVKIFNTGHMLLCAMREGNSVTAQQAALCGISTTQIEEYVSALPAEEDYYEEMRALENLRLNIRARAGQSSAQDSRPASEEDSADGDGYSDDEDEFGYNTDSAVQGQRSRRKTSALEKFGVDMTRAAAEGQIDPVVGRDAEIERVIQILGRRKKNNPMLIGAAGVGKSAIVEGLALRIAANQVPYPLRGKTIFSLDLASMVAGTKYRGQFEERIKALLDEITRDENIILFVDEIHNIVGAGSTQGSLDTANILKPALARGQVQCIGATTLDEYRENIEKDAALERRFQKIIVEPATQEQTIEILNNIKSYYEGHHMVRYTDEAIAACVELTGRYITDRCFPDKAIDVMDEAGSKARMGMEPEPETIGSLDASLRAARAMRRENLALQNYPAAAEARIREVALRNRIEEANREWLDRLRDNPVEITATHIEQVVTSMTGVPVERVSQDECGRLREMCGYLSGRVMGQQDAVGKVTRSIQRSRAGLKDPGKPIGVFMFVGPTGVGKTLLAKELSMWMFDKPEALIRIDMSEYSEKHNVSRLIGSPPGYVGYGEGGQLTEAVRRQPYAVVLFDEIEKAHPDVFNIMLQIFDEGRLTDGLGRKVDFRNTVVIMTSNVGSRQIASRGRAVGFTTASTDGIVQATAQSQYRMALEQTFAPEFINRIDDIVIFNTLTGDDIGCIIDTEIGTLAARAATLGYTLRVTDQARRMLAELGYEPRYGVRSLKRTILETIEEPLAEMIVSGQVTPGDTVEIAWNDCKRIELLTPKAAA